MHLKQFQDIIYYGAAENKSHNLCGFKLVINERNLIIVTFHLSQLFEAQYCLITCLMVYGVLGRK